MPAAPSKYCYILLAKMILLLLLLALSGPARRSMSAVSDEQTLRTIFYGHSSVGITLNMAYSCVGNV